MVEIKFTLTPVTIITKTCRHLWKVLYSFNFDTGKEEVECEVCIKCGKRREI